MAESTWTHYKLQRQIFSIGEDFWIENDRGEQLFKVDGKALSLRETFVLEDNSGAELLTIEAKLLAVRPTMKILQVEGGPVYEAEGKITNHEYEVKSNGAVVAQISKQWFTVTDTYGIAVAPGQDDVLMLASAICIDELSEEKRG